MVKASQPAIAVGIASRILLQPPKVLTVFWDGPPVRKASNEKAWPKPGIFFHQKFVSKKLFFDQTSNFGAGGLILAQASWLATLCQQSKNEVRLSDNKIRISGAWRADVTGFGA